MTHIYHITTDNQAAEAKRTGVYTPVGYARDGFIHCSYLHQVEGVANRIFIGQGNLVVLKIDKSLLKPHTVDENLEGGTELFPHIYGRLEWSTVVDVIPYLPDANGVFQTPSGQS